MDTACSTYRGSNEKSLPPSPYPLMIHTWIGSCYGPAVDPRRLDDDPNDPMQPWTFRRPPWTYDDDHRGGMVVVAYAVVAILSSAMTAGVIALVQAL